ncbi:hypothetical protein CRG98_011777 [Punica granatum]|uniref:Uncharacterized protein n=1 Tax=Punica granatum TaxID=22663 RepID=A0A2I0KH44_PUNGR|nr:hypothetical protein CRG98_011777 [Punica granatum]
MPFTVDHGSNAHAHRVYATRVRNRVLPRLTISLLVVSMWKTTRIVMRQTTWQVGIWRKIGSNDPISKETASGGKLTAFGREKRRFRPNFII